LVTAEQPPERGVNWIETGVAEGAKLVLDGRNITVPGYVERVLSGAYDLRPCDAKHARGQQRIFGRCSASSA
jgi:malonate-semialdehyde dehydrogenase (acetylating)/methylmalonate-semialdehyde dehydrogenase